jgi:hypothetical protein
MAIDRSAAQHHLQRTARAVPMARAREQAKFAGTEILSLVDNDMTKWVVAATFDTLTQSVTNISERVQLS